MESHLASAAMYALVRVYPDLYATSQDPKLSAAARYVKSHGRAKTQNAQTNAAKRYLAASKVSYLEDSRSYSIIPLSIVDSPDELAVLIALVDLAEIIIDLDMPYDHAMVPVLYNCMCRLTEVDTERWRRALSFFDVTRIMKNKGVADIIAEFARNPTALGMLYLTETLMLQYSPGYYLDVCTMEDEDAVFEATVRNVAALQAPQLYFSWSELDLDQEERYTALLQEHAPGVILTL